METDLRPVVVRAAFHEARRRVPKQMESALARGDKPWSWFAAEMFSLDVSVETRRRLEAVFRGPSRWNVRADGRQDRRQTVRYQPVKPTSDAELRATTVAEFIALLKLVQVRSGVNPGRIAERVGAGLSRSQAYLLVSERAPVLPTRIGQVRLFLLACGLDDHQVDTVARLWVELKEQRDTGVAVTRGDRQAPPRLVERVVVFTGVDRVATDRYLREGGSCFDGQVVSVRSETTLR